MPNEIYHRSEWGNPKAEGFGDVYFDASATNKLYKHSDNYENSDGTDKILRDIPNKASIVLTPTAYSDGSLNTVIPTDGNGDFDFSRGSSATRVNEQGLIEDVASNIPRIDYTSGQGALLLEPQRTNLVAYSEDFSNSAWTKERATISDNISTSPDGSVNASKIIENTQNGSHSIFDGVAITNNIYTFSCFVKKSERDYCFLQIVTNLGRYTAVFDLVNGVVTDTQTVSSPTNTSNKIENYGNGWYRVSVTSSNTTSTTGFFQVGTSNSATPSYNSFKQPTYTGDGSSIIIWGAQAEALSFKTSYIPTEGSTVTRSADVANNSGNADLFNDSEGVLYAEIAALASVSTNKDISISDGSTSNRIIIRVSSSTLLVYVISSGVTSMFKSTVINEITSLNKFAVKYKQNDFALWVNGVEIATDTSGNTPTGLDTLNFDGGTGADDFYGNVKSVAVFKEALTDAELESLTSWISFVEMATDLEYTLE